MSTLKEEREALARYMHIKYLAKAKTAKIDGSELTVLPYGYLSQAVEEALLSHEEKVMERVQKEKEDIFGEIEQFKSEVATMNYNDDFKDGIYATIEHILSMPCFESVLTPITE